MMNEQVSAAFQLLPEYLSQHLLLSASAVGIASFLSLPAAFLISSRPRARAVALGLARTVQTIPGLALIALFYPLLLFLSPITNAWVGVPLPTLGFLPALLALITFAILPILQGSVLGLTQIDPDIIAAADAVGMTRRQFTGRKICNCRGSFDRPGWPAWPRRSSTLPPS
jgi:osmoprotectant transport system permease protein